ncbi:MAG: basic amino acid/polyamine antiporter [Enterococcus sp.]
MNGKKAKGIGLIPLIAIVIGSAIGGGIFGIMSDLSGSAAGPTLLSWGLVGGAMLMLSLSINNLNKKRPDLDGGIYSYATEGFGRFAGFISGWGYWLTCWLGNVAFASLLMSALGYFFPVLQGGQNVASVILSTIFLWMYAWLVNRGVENASVVNAIVTICKLLPLLIFVLVSFVSFRLPIFLNNFSANAVSQATGLPTNLSSQMMGCIMVMLWVFVGIEGASAVSSRAKDKADVGKATVLGIIGLIIVYILVSMLPYGILSMEQLESIKTQPAMGAVFELMVGKWGAVLVNGGLIISLIGVWLSWSILPIETLRNMSQDGLLPASLQKVNRAGAPTRAIVITTICTNLFLLSLLFTEAAYNFAYTLGTAAVFFTWLFLALYQIKLSYQRSEWGQLVIGGIAAAFILWTIFFVALKEVSIISVLFVPGVYFYLKAKKQHQGIKENKLEPVVIGTVSLLGVISLVLVATGMIQI